ncbi:MAG: hypothetical protein F6J94_13910 [Moorea sp. SIO1F2]|uniref:hypothetical protein n=1 Tax=unclassified Moorena TaxID=2683338 RepID=UPI0013BDFB58|nr:MULTISPECIES: hypothetical protein [unclassified Moorena]NEP24104.1 hypothetical protein [Moorena sp. SIO3I6]NET82982.1 hypothetical protein [Moorena sp. SIO1F2]
MSKLLSLNDYKPNQNRQSESTLSFRDNNSSNLEGESYSQVWVKAPDIPNSIHCEEALILCRQSENTWLAWIPDYGEIILSDSELANLI